MVVERGAETNELEALLGECLQGRGAMALVSGPVAAGKTALVQALARRAVAAGATTIGATASRAERNLPLGVIGQLLADPHLARESAGNASRLPELDALAALVREEAAGPADEISAHVRDRVCRVMLDLAAQAPLLITVDDVHHADVESLRCLSHLTRRVHAMPIMIVLTESVRVQPAHTLFQAELLPRSSYRLIQLDLLSPRGVAEMARRRLGDEAGPDLAAEFHRISGGNPALVQALLDDHQDPAGDKPCGEAFGHALVGCLYRFERCMLPLAGAVAVVGDAGDPALLSALTGLETEWVERAISVLKRSGVLDDIRFRHPGARAAVLDGMTAKERAAVHARTARVLHDTGAPATRVAHHLLAADDATVIWAAPVLREAADRALVDGDVDLAIRCLRLAHRAGEDNVARAGAVAALARAEWRLDPSIAARRTADLITDVRHGRLADRFAIAPIIWLFWFGRIEEGLEALEELDRGSASTADVLDATRLLLSYAYPSLSAQLKPPSAWGRLIVAGATVSPGLRAAERLMAVLGRGPDDDVLDGIERFLRDARLDNHTLVPVLISLVILIYGGRLDAAAARCDALRRAAESLCALTWQALFHALRAEIAFRQGELTAADRYGRAAFTLMSADSWGVAIGLPLATLIEAAVVSGHYQDAADHLRTPVPDALFQTIFGLLYLRARGRYHQAVGNLTAALADFRSCGELMMRWRADYPALIAWRTDAASVLARMGRHRYAQKLIREHEARLEALADRRGPGPSEPVAAPEPPPKLSDAERRVASLAASGMTNSQIARRLFVTVSTVEQHLTRVYRKLGVSSRDHLPARLFGRSAD